MSGSKKSPLRMFGRHKSVDQDPKPLKSTNPFDLDKDPYDAPTLNSSNRTSSVPLPTTADLKSDLFSDYGDEGKRATSSSARNKYKNDFRESGGYENQSVQELEGYAVYKSEETTKTVNDCLKIAEDIRENASQTLVTLHHQGEQITRTHQTAADIDHDLSRGEKLLGSLGGMFKPSWKPKKNHHIKGPTITRDDSFIRNNHLQQKERAGLNLAPKKGRSRTPPPEPTNAFEQVEYEKAKQDDALSNISDILGDLKVMAVDMGSELERHNKALEDVYEDVDEINRRVGGATQRARRLLGK